MIKRANANQDDLKIENKQDLIKAKIKIIVPKVIGFLVKINETINTNEYRPKEIMDVIA